MKHGKTGSIILKGLVALCGVVSFVATTKLDKRNHEEMVDEVTQNVLDKMSDDQNQEA